MIKINLLKSKGGRGFQQSANTNTDINYDSSYQNASIEDVSTESSSKDKIVKVLLLIMLTGILVVYERYNIGTLTSKEANIFALNKTLADELEQKKPIAEKARELQKNILDLEVRIKSVKGLSTERLREIRTIDFIQNVIPERVWLSKLEFEKGTLRLEGGAMSDEELNKFIASLEANSFFKNVILMRAVEQSSKEGTVKVFSISSNVVSAD